MSRRFTSPFMAKSPLLQGYKKSPYGGGSKEEVIAHNKEAAKTQEEHERNIPRGEGGGTKPKPDKDIGKTPPTGGKPKPKKKPQTPGRKPKKPNPNPSKTVKVGKTTIEVDEKGRFGKVVGKSKPK